MADASRQQLYYSEETTWGVASTAAYNELRFTSHSLAQTAEYVQSNEIRSDRQVTDVIRVNVGAGGSIETELSYGAYDDLFQGAFANTFSTGAGVSSTAIQASSTGSKFFGIDFTATNIQAGQFIKASGNSSTAANGFYRVTAVGSTSISVQPAPANSTGGTVTMIGDFLKNGTSERSYTFEVYQSDISSSNNPYESFPGSRLGESNFTITPGSILTGSFSVLGKNSSVAAASNGSTTVAASTNDVQNAVDNIKLILEGGSTVSVDVTEISFTLTNNLRDKPAVGELGNIDIGYGRVGVTGTFNLYFENNELYSKFLNDTETSLAFVSEDGDGNALAFDFPQAKITNATKPNTGNDTDIFVNAEFTAYRDPTNDFTIGLTRMPAA